VFTSPWRLPRASNFTVPTSGRPHRHTGNARSAMQRAHVDTSKRAPRFRWIAHQGTSESMLVRIDFC
jgi:hypothetical protein